MTLTLLMYLLSAEIACGNDAFSTLCTAVTQAGLGDALSSGTWTVRLPIAKIIPKSNAGMLRRPPKNLSDRIPEKNVEKMPAIALTGQTVPTTGAFGLRDVIRYEVVARVASVPLEKRRAA